MIENENVGYKEIHRGEIWYISFGQTFGSEMQKTRPVVIISNESCNTHSSICTVVPITSKEKKPLPTHVDIPESIEVVHGIIMCEQITTISKLRLVNYVGNIDDSTLQKIEQCICVQCAISDKDIMSQIYALNEKLQNMTSRANYLKSCIKRK